MAETKEVGMCFVLGIDSGAFGGFKREWEEVTGGLFRRVGALNLEAIDV